MVLAPVVAVEYRGSSVREKRIARRFDDEPRVMFRRYGDADDLSCEQIDHGRHADVRSAMTEMREVGSPHAPIV